MESEAFVWIFSTHCVVVLKLRMLLQVDSFAGNDSNIYCFVYWPKVCYTCYITRKYSEKKYTNKKNYADRYGVTAGDKIQYNIDIIQMHKHTTEKKRIYECFSVEIVDRKLGQVMLAHIVEIDFFFFFENPIRPTKKTRKLAMLCDIEMW